MQKEYLLPFILILLLKLQSALKTVLTDQIFDRIDNWIREESGWIVESFDGEYVNVSIYSPLLESL